MVGIRPLIEAPLIIREISNRNWVYQMVLYYGLLAIVHAWQNEECCVMTGNCVLVKRIRQPWMNLIRVINWSVGSKLNSLKIPLGKRLDVFCRGFFLNHYNLSAFSWVWISSNHHLILCDVHGYDEFLKCHYWNHCHDSREGSGQFLWCEGIQGPKSIP